MPQNNNSFSEERFPGVPGSRHRILLMSDRFDCYARDNSVLNEAEQFLHSGLSVFVAEYALSNLWCEAADEISG